MLIRVYSVEYGKYLWEQSCVQRIVGNFFWQYGCALSEYGH